MSEPVTEEDCRTRESIMHTRINQRVPWILIVPLTLAIMGFIGGAYKYTHSVELAQKELVTKTDFKEFRIELKQLV